MEVSNERSSESELQLRSVREQIYPKEGSREADFLFVDSEVVGEIDENRDADEDADISTRSATSGLMADYDVSVSYDVNKSEDATEMIDVEKEIAAAQTRNAKQFATFTESQLDLDHHQGSRSLQMKPEASVELSTLNNLSAPSHSFAQHSATLSNSSERNMARVEPQVQIRTRSIEQSAVVNKWISNSEGQFGGDNIAGDNGVGEKKTKSLQGIGSEPVNGVNHTAEEKVDLAAFKTLEAVAGELRQGLGLVFEQLNRIVDGDSSLAKQLDTHRSELAEVCRLAVGLRSDMSNLTQRQERLENELRDLKMELGVRYSTASEISLAGAQNSISRRRQGDGASAGCLDNVVGGGSQNSELNRAPSPKFNCASSRLSSIRNFKTQSKTSEIDNMRTSAAAKTSSLKLSDDQLPYPSSSSVQSSNSELTDTIGRSNAGDPVEHFDELVKDRFVGHVATHTELYEMLHHLIGHYLKSSRKMESCIQKSEFSHFNSRQMFPSVLRAIKECNQQLWKSWNTCVESLQDRTVVRKTLGGESERNGSLSSLRDIFAENLQSALRLFIDNDLEKIYINGCRSYFEALPTCVTHLNLACQNSKTFANYIEDQVRCTQTKFAKHSIWDTSILRSQMEVLHWMLLMPYRLLKLDQSFLNTASNFLTKCTCTSHAHNNSDPIVAERDNSNTQPTRESEQQPSASTAQTVIISTSAFNDRQESDSSHANNDDPDLICSESALKFTAALRLIHEVSTSMAKCVKEAETVMVNCRDLQCDLSADLLGNGTFPKLLSSNDTPTLPPPDLHSHQLSRKPQKTYTEGFSFDDKGTADYQNEEVFSSYLQLNKLLNSQVSSDTVMSDDAIIPKRGIPKSQTIQDFAQVQLSNCPTPTNISNKTHSSSTECLNKSSSRHMKSTPMKRDLIANEHYANCKCDQCFDSEKRDNQLVPSSLYENNFAEFEQYELEKSLNRSDDKPTERSATSTQLFEDLENICMDAEMTVKALLPFNDLKDMIRNDHTVMNNDEILIKETGDQLIIHQKVQEESPNEPEVETEPVNEPAYQITDISEDKWMNEFNHVVPAKAKPNPKTQANSTDAKMYYHRYIMPYQKSGNRSAVIEPPQKDENDAQSSKKSSRRGRSKTKKHSVAVVDNAQNFEPYENRANSLTATWNKVRSRTPSLKSDLCGGLLAAENSDVRDYYNMNAGLNSSKRESVMSKSEQHLNHNYGFLVESQNGNFNSSALNGFDQIDSFEMQINEEDTESLPYTKIDSPHFKMKNGAIGLSTRTSGGELTAVEPRNDDRKSRSKSLKSLFGMKSRDKRKKSRPDSASTYSREAGGVGSTESTLDSRMRHQRTDCSTPNVHRHTIDYSSVAVAENEQDHSVVRNCLSNQDNFRQNEPSNCVSTDDFYNSNYVSNGYHDQKRNGYNSLCSSGRSLSQTSLSIHSSSDHTLEGRDNEGIFDNGMGVLEVEDNLDDWDIPIVAPSFSPVDVKLAQNNRSKRTAIVARYDVAPDISQMPGPVQQRIQRTPKFYRPISMQSNASNKHLTSHEDLAPSYHSSNADQSFASSNDPTETVPQGLVQARSKAFEQIANSSFNLTDQPRNTHSSSNQHQYNSSFNRSQNLVGTQCATPGYVRGSKTVDSFQTGHYLYDDGRQLNGLYSTQKAPVNKSGFNINSNNFSNNIATTYDNRTRNKHVL
ncbi:uncharacterized protein LOC142351806 isoform X2 [Convolutriloba macropyga]|uniref:uncharacterized protein LOC142351806 isoform X2 n=1 Tax=Convolutriloba macropyga TaxID=536237 RepID=UPI003F520562